MRSTQEQCALALKRLMRTIPYSQITIALICKEVPVSRKTFYGYFQSKDDLLLQIMKKDFMDNAFPIIKSGMGEKGVRAFFKYILANSEFYKAVYLIDEGTFLHRGLVGAYGIAVENVTQYAHPVKNNEKRINPTVYKLYTHSAIASIVAYWVRSDYDIDIDDITRDTGLMMEHPLSYVRDRYLL